MPHDPILTERVRKVLRDLPGVSEKKMFGGVCFLLNDNMLCGVDRDRLMFRVGRAQEALALSRPGARPMDITGKPMAGFVFVDPAECDARRLKSWVTLARAYVDDLPPKKK